MWKVILRNYVIFINIINAKCLLDAVFEIIAPECGLPKLDCLDPGKYRSIDGSCNNLNNANWGTVFSTYDRILSPKYGDGVHSFPTASSGKDLPNPRLITTKIFVNGLVESISNFTLATMEYGQLVAHDMSFNFLSLPNGACCTEDLKRLPIPFEKCASILVPKFDPYFSKADVECISFSRTLTNKDLLCQPTLEYENQLNSVNSYLDLSIIYGHTKEIHLTLRTFKDGLLLTETRNNHEWLPASIIPVLQCPGNLNLTEKCYRTGDIRVNQNPQLTVLHTLYTRNHNRLSRLLKAINSHWNDERLFEEARRINIAIHQYISYYELLPLYLGKEEMIKRRILCDTNEFVNDYDEKERPHIYNEHAHAAYRHFHTLISGELRLVNQEGCPYASLNLRDNLDRPNSLEEYNVFDGYIRGFTSQPQMGSDRFHDPDVTGFGFLNKLRFGIDLKSVDIQRSRDHGLGSYNNMRKHCGLKKATHFDDFLDVIDTDNVELLKELYTDVNDVDLIVGGTLEQIAPGTLAGPTILCIMYKQFLRTRKSDRFWFENENNGLTLNQLQEIRKYSFAKLLCDNGHNIEEMQKHGFLRICDNNPRVPCRDLPNININMWKESYENNGARPHDEYKHISEGSQNEREEHEHDRDGHIHRKNEKPGWFGKLKIKVKETLKAI